MEFKISPEHLEKIKLAYEKQRKVIQRKEDRLTEIFDTDYIESEVESFFNTTPIRTDDTIKIEMDIEFDKSELRKRHWLSYIHTLYEIQEAWGSFNFWSQPKDVESPRRGFVIVKEVKPVIIDNKVWKKRTVKTIKEYLEGFFLPKSFNFGKYLTVKVSTPRAEMTLAFKSRDAAPLYPIEYRNKKLYEDAITLEDMPLVFEFYKNIHYYVLRDICGRGLTVKCAVKKGEGESITRRNDNKGNRLVFNNPNDLGKGILDYLIYELVADVNIYGQSYLTRIPFDFDPPKSMSYYYFSEFVNEFASWLSDRGFKFNFRKTGGKGAHIIIPMDYNRVPKNYNIPFPRPLKFDTWYKRLGDVGVLCASAADFVKITVLGFAKERKMKNNKKSRITIERDNPAQRLWNMYVDWTRTSLDFGVRSLGSIHHKTGGVCIPIKKLPDIDTVENVIKCSNDATVKVPKTFDPRYKSIWIYLIGNNPHLLLEETISRKANTISLVEEMFEEFGWIPQKYRELGSERFLAKYCW